MGCPWISFNTSDPHPSKLFSKIKPSQYILWSGIYCHVSFVMTFLMHLLVSGIRKISVILLELTILVPNIKDSHYYAHEQIHRYKNYMYRIWYILIYNYHLCIYFLLQFLNWTWYISWKIAGINCLRHTLKCTCNQSAQAFLHHWMIMPNFSHYFCPLHACLWLILTFASSVFVHFTKHCYNNHIFSLIYPATALVSITHYHNLSRAKMTPPSWNSELSFPVLAMFSSTDVEHIQT